MIRFFSSGRLLHRRPTPRLRQRRRDDQRGYVLIAAIALAILYFGLMELMLMESQRTLREAQRFRAKIIATTLAENAAELAAENLCQSAGSKIDYTNGDGQMAGTLSKKGSDPQWQFIITGTGTSNGVPTSQETVQLDGHITRTPVGFNVAIEYSNHLSTQKGGL